MDHPTMFDPLSLAPDLHVLPGYVPIPGLGILPCNAFVLGAAEPVLVDTGVAAVRDDFRTALESVIDPTDLRWLWLTHTDHDHLGSLGWLLEENPDLRIVTTFLGVGKMNLHAPLPMERCHWVNPGETLDVGDRVLTALRPPSFDAPETTGFHDPHTGAVFTSDCFGALLSAPAEVAGDVGPADLEEGMLTWATIDAPWLHLVDPQAFQRELDAVGRLDPTVVLSSHLPAAAGTVQVGDGSEHGLVVSGDDLLGRGSIAESP